MLSTPTPLFSGAAPTGFSPASHALPLLPDTSRPIGCALIPPPSCIRHFAYTESSDTVHTHPGQSPSPLRQCSSVHKTPSRKTVKHTEQPRRRCVRSSTTPLLHPSPSAPPLLSLRLQKISHPKKETLHRVTNLPYPATSKSRFLVPFLHGADEGSHFSGARRAFGRGLVLK
ncbi:hypothetical protein B0H14DRAFT_3518085 [Mycena olivaceomarginata]|nr:hypothetical protein B0H14DRAFT_3518085 [Mycena olivaceomarginata]